MAVDLKATEPEPLFDGQLDASNGLQFLSEAQWIPREAIRTCVEVYAVEISAHPTPTVTVKIRQGVEKVATLPDRALTSPTGLETISGSAREILDDDVVGNYVQFDVSADIPCKVRVLACTR